MLVFPPAVGQVRVPFPSEYGVDEKKTFLDRTQNRNPIILNKIKWSFYKILLLFYELFILFF